MAAIRGMIKRTHIIIRVNDRLAMQKSGGKESEKEWIRIDINRCVTESVSCTPKTNTTS